MAPRRTATKATVAYDRTTGTARVSPQPEGAAPPTSKQRRKKRDDTSSDSVSSEERVRARRQMRRERVQHWSDRYPVRMRRWIQQYVTDVAARIFCEVVIRLPMRNARQAEVLGLLQNYGDVEYIGPLATGAKDDARVVGLDIGHCHVVRFRDGIDGVRCYLELNGACIDPQQYNDAMDQMAVLMQGFQQSANGVGDDEVEDDLPSSASAMPKPADAIMAGLRIANSSDDCDPTSLIFVTVDFFRLAFAPPAPSGGIPARCSLGQAQRGVQKPLRPSGETPTLWLAQRLAMSAMEAAELYPIVVSHSGLGWEGFCDAANVAGMMLTTATPNQFYAWTVPKTAHPSKLAELKARLWEPSNFSAAYEGLGRANFDSDDVLRLVDVSQSPEELIRGLKHKSNPATDSARRVLRTLEAHPMIAGFVMLITVALVVTIVLGIFFEGSNFLKMPSSS